MIWIKIDDRTNWPIRFGIGYRLGEAKTYSVANWFNRESERDSTYNTYDGARISNISFEQSLIKIFKELKDGHSIEDVQQRIKDACKEYHISAMIENNQ